MDTTETWQAALGELELSLSKANFTTWFKNTFIASIDNGRVTVCVPNTFTKAWLEKKYHDSILKALRNVTSNAVREVSYRVEVRQSPLGASPTTSPPTVETSSTNAEQFTLQETSAFSPQSTSADAAFPSAWESGLNPRYRFETFVVGKTNELAHAATMAVAAKPGTAYNPLFIYGGSGLGKTHLLHAIGHHAKITDPSAKILYITCERFINEFIQAVRSGKSKDFKEVYRAVDVLLVDDIQFISGKEATQEEFFHTFNTLHQSNKQIVLTSDRPPKDIHALESRLLSRFEWGMMADISSPDFETRVAILESKIREKSLNLEPELMRYIAGTIQSNVRELEGALNKILAYHQFKNLVPSLESVQSLLQTYAPSIPKRSVTPRRLLEIVAAYYDLPMDALLGKSREQRLAFPRQIAMYLLREEAKCSFPSIGSHVGGRDHTTAIHACGKIHASLQKDEQLQRDISSLREKIYASVEST